MLLFYVRHGDPTYRPDALTPLGRRQAEAVARRLALYGLDGIYASTSARAIQTAEPTAEILKMEITQLDFCNEAHAWRDFAPLNDAGRNSWLPDNSKYRALLCSPALHAMGKEWYRHEAFAETTVAEGVARVARETDAFFASLGYRHIPEENCYEGDPKDSRRIALFAHAGFGDAFLSYVLDIPYPVYSTRFALGHSGMTVIEFKPDACGRIMPCMLQLSNDSHLYRDGLPTNYQNRICF